MVRSKAPIPSQNGKTYVVLHTCCSSIYSASWLFVGFILSFFMGILCPQDVFSQEAVYVDYVESFNPACDTNSVSLPILNKERRLKSSSCLTFNIKYNNDVPDSVVKCLIVASDVWRSCLNVKSDYPVNLQLKWDSLPCNEDVKISVLYYINADNNYVPSSLYKIQNSLSEGNSIIDAVIKINRNVNWDCGYYKDNNNGVRNLSYAMLRSIAVSLGFGTSLSYVMYNSVPIVKFKFSHGHSLFENLLVSDNGIWLKNLSNTGKRQNPEIINYCTGVYGNVYIDGNYSSAEEKAKYKMYTPSTFENSKSLVYLDNKQSLMHYSLDKNSIKLQVDSFTVNVLNKLGWNAVASNQNNIKIIGSGIPESGITSAYTSHQFYIEGEEKSELRNARWSFYLPTIDGKDSLLKSTEGVLSFSIDSISNPDDYAVNVNGDIYGKVVFTGILNGTAINLPYYVTLELKPSISNVTFVKKNNGKDNSYDVFCKVDYKGSDYLYVTLEEEYGSSLRSQFVREPYLAHFAYNNITAPYYAWIDIKAENIYGSAVFTIELPPYNDFENHQYSVLNNLHSLTKEDFTEIRVYNSMGYYVKTITKYSETKALQSGMYILEYFNGRSKIKTSKLLR